jgi:hypothetical protein
MFPVFTRPLGSKKVTFDSPSLSPSTLNELSTSPSELVLGTSKPLVLVSSLFVPGVPAVTVFAVVVLTRSAHDLCTVFGGGEAGFGVWPDVGEAVLGSAVLSSTGLESE